MDSWNSWLLDIAEKAKDKDNDISSLLVEPATVYRPAIDPNDIRPLLVEG